MMVSHIIFSMIDIDNIKKRIIETLKQSGYTQIELAKKLKVSQSCIAHYIRGDILPSLDTLANICKICDVSPSYIMFFDEN